MSDTTDPIAAMRAWNQQIIDEFRANGGKVFIFASKAGAPSHPDWYHNLVANPDVTVEIGSETRAAVASTVSPSERDRIYAIQAERYPGFAEYEEKTTRVIPVVELTFS